MTRPVRMGAFALRVDDDQPTFWDRVEAGRWEPGTLAALDRLVGPDTTFLDLGAWIGALSLYAAARGARAVAVEADPAALDQLRRNLAANPDLAARITVVPRAVSRSAAPLRLGAKRKPGDSMSSALRADAATSWLADAVTPEELLAFLGDTRAFVCKLDVEGGEYALLPALAPLLARAAALLVALHPAILEESGERDLEGVQRRAFAPYAAWTAERIDTDGERLPERQPVADMLGAVMAGEWLLRPR